METRKLIIVRGASGSGKSTIAKILAGDSGVICEADQFFERNGHYIFEANLLGQAHAFCQNKVKQAMASNKELIVLSNTSMTLKEIQPYFDLAKEAGYTVEVIRTPGPWRADILVKRNLHGVPLGTVQKQINKYQPFEGEIEWTK